jgi:CRISPR-associated DxTHG motif protein
VTTYRFRDREFRTPVIQEALSSFFSIDEIVLFMTTKARETNHQMLMDRLNSPRVVMIPEGRSEEELWAIFSAVASHVDEGDEVIFDITHGFRSLPFLALLSAAYLREVKHVSIRAVTYGAFEARTGSETPVFDLSPFIRIFDWMDAVRSFITHVDAGPMKDLVREHAIPELRSQEKGDIPVNLMRFSRDLDNFTKAVRLSRPEEAISFASSIVSGLPAAAGEITKHTPPLAPVVGRIAEVSRFAPSDPGSGEGISPEHLRLQRDLIGFQVEKGLYTQAITLAREWMITVLVVAKGDGERWLDRGVRQDAENAISGMELKMQKKRYTRSDYSDWFETQPFAKECTRIWGRLSALRNDIAHCGMNPNKKSIDSIEKNIRAMCTDLGRFLAITLPGYSGEINNTAPVS